MAGSEIGPARRRRNRVPVSCASCRALKTKCDGLRPVCSTCALNNRQCTFALRGGSSRNVMVSEEYLRSLEKRIEGLSSQGATPAHPPAEHPKPHQSTQQPGTTPSSVVVDANVSIGGASFTQFVLNSLHGHENVQAQPIMASGNVRNSQSPLTLDDLYSLPDNALEILNRYFVLRNLIAPVFHVPSVRPMLTAALNSPPTDRHRHRPALILLNMTFALCTSHWMDDTYANPRMARRYYDIAMALMQPTLLRDTTLEHVQALLLAARYLQGTSCGDECWNILGLAIRIAYGLRLHQEPPETDPPPVRETKRRVWYAAYTLDMHWSMVYQRPPATRSSAFTVSMPEDLDDDCIQPDRILYPSPRQPSTMSFFIEVIKLSRIVENMLGRLSESKIDAKETAELVLALDGEHQTWLRERPAHLVLDHSDPHEAPWILALRGNMLRIFIHRQSLKHQQSEDSLAGQILQYSRRICVAAAMETIDIVALRHDQTRKTLGLNFFNIYYLFNAVIVLMSHLVSANTTDQPALEKVDKALHMISFMSSNYSLAQWAHSFLQHLLGYMHHAVGPPQPAPATSTSESSGSLPPTEDSANILTPTNGSSDAPQDLHTLFGFAQDITENLESVFGSMDPSLPEALWQFNDEAVF